MGRLILAKHLIMPLQPTANYKDRIRHMGDLSPTTAGMENVFIDPDVNDLGDIANPANVNATQG
jgi:hypothetical protein